MSTVTIKDIARLAGVSHSTVSRTLNGAPGVNRETREKILALCRQQGYHANFLARSLSAGRSDIISCILPGLDDPLFSEMVLDLERYMQPRGYHIMACHGRVEDPDISQLFDFLIGHRVAGIILFSSSRAAPELIRRYIQRVPIVLQGIFDASASAAIPAVTVDNLAGGRMAAEYLYRLGHRKAVYLGVRENSVSHSLRCKSFLDTARRLGMAVRVLPNETNASTVDVGYYLAKQLFLEDLQETAVFASCDSIALGVMSAAKEFHLSIPRDFSLMGFDNISYAAYPRIRLTTLDPRKKELMELSVEHLLNCMDAPERLKAQLRAITPVLLERDTCGRI